MASTVVLGQSFVRHPTETLQLTLPNQAAAAANQLGNVIGGLAPYSIPTTGVVAKASGTQATATAVSGTFVRVDTVATAADAIGLPLAVAGLRLFITNNGANSMQVFGAGTDTINGVATATGVAQAAGVSAVYWCSQSAPAGKWHRIQSS